ncbi:hypothetical protein [Alicyclobacillus vulcanalis]|uniref:hypothetical protein n=1 Tax=Alicyclobacillus vulcanalis TaxID=252246 RepID=UPI0011784B74|nr:hypothetical protein [Alicyclobacillus vulcanalis]
MKKAAEQLEVMYKAGVGIISTALLFWLLDSIPWIEQHARWYIAGLACASLATCAVIVSIACVRFIIFYRKRM